MTLSLYEGWKWNQHLDWHSSRWPLYTPSPPPQRKACLEFQTYSQEQHTEIEWILDQSSTRGLYTVILHWHMHNVMYRHTLYRSLLIPMLVGGGGGHITSPYGMHVCKRGFFREFFYVFHFLALLLLPPLEFRCVGGCWDWAQECCDFGIASQTTSCWLSPPPPLGATKAGRDHLNKYSKIPPSSPLRYASNIAKPVKGLYYT